MGYHLAELQTKVHCVLFFGSQCIKQIASVTMINNKRAISGNNATGRRLPTNAVSVLQCIFSCDHLLGTVELTHFRF